MSVAAVPEWTEAVVAPVAGDAAGDVVVEAVADEMSLTSGWCC